MVKFTRDSVVESHCAITKKQQNMQPFVYYIDKGCLGWLAWNGEAFVAMDEFLPNQKVLDSGEQYKSLFVTLIPSLTYAGERCVNPQLATDEHLKAAVKLLDAKRKPTPTCQDYEWEYRVVYWEGSRRVNARNPRYRPSTVGKLPRDSAKRKTKIKK